MVPRTFEQKYIIAHLSRRVPDDATLVLEDWRRHITIVDAFSTTWSAVQLIDHIAEYCRSLTSPIKARVVEQSYLGENNTIPVNMLAPTDRLLSLHAGLIETLTPGGLVLNRPEHAKNGFVPHSAIWPDDEARTDVHNVIAIDTLTLIDMFPGGNPHKRVALKTFLLPT